MTYKLDFLEEALAEWNKLNPSIKQPLKKKLIKVLENPRIPKNKLSGHPNRYKDQTSQYWLSFGLRSH